MKRREISKRIGMAAGALLCLMLAMVLAVLAADVARWSEAISSGDVRYRVYPEDRELWQAEELVPTGLASKLLGVRDDVAFRRAVRALRVAHLDDSTVSDPEIAIRRNEAQALLEAIATGDGDRTRRSRAAGLLGALGLARLVSETQERGALLSGTVASLQLAVALDSANDDAKYNLELALQRGRGLQLTEGAGGANPTPGGSGAKGAGAGEPGSGY